MATETITAPPRRPPTTTTGTMGWLRANLFNSLPNALLTLVLLYAIVRAIWGGVSWLLTTDGWIAVQSNLRLLMVGPYPADELWRVELSVWLVAFLLGTSAALYKGVVRAIAIGVAALMALLVVASFLIPDLAPAAGAAPSANPITPLLFMLGTLAILAAGYGLGQVGGTRLRWPVTIGWLLSYPVLMTFVIYGAGPLGHVEMTLWGGLLVTVMLAVVGIIASFPLGVLLALGRRSELPVVRLFCTAYIETIRGVPLITVLFIGSLILPLFVPERILFIPAGNNIPGLVRAMVAITLFSATYLAENVRGGLQSIPKGQYEASVALGLNYWQTTLFIILPQALRAVIPALVGQFISLFKDTSLVTIVGLFDLLGIAQQVSRQPDWLGIPGGVFRELLVFISVIYFIVCFTMSRVSQRVERNLGVGQR